MKDGDFRSINDWTGPEARAAGVTSIAFPELLAPVDDLPPATLITSIQPKGARLTGASPKNILTTPFSPARIFLKIVVAKQCVDRIACFLINQPPSTMHPRTASAIVPAFLTFAVVIANRSHADTVTQTSLITATNPDYLYWEGESFDRVTAPGANPLWRVNFDPPAGSSGGKTIMAPAAPNDTPGANDSLLIYRFQLPAAASAGDYFFYAFRTGGAGDSMFPPPGFNADPFQAPLFPNPGNGVNRWNTIADNTWNQLGRVGDYPGTGYFATNNYTYRVASSDIGNVLEFRIEAREANAQFDRFVLHKSDNLTAAQLNALTFSNVSVANPVQAPPPSVFQLPNGAPEGDSGYFGIREKINNGNMDNQDNARASLANTGGTTYDYNAPLLNIQDSGGAGNFGGDSPFGVTTAAVGPAYGGVDHIAMFVSGTVRIPVAGVYTFGVNSDDGFTLLIMGANFTDPVNATLQRFVQGTALTFFGGRGASDSFGQVTLPAGDHNLYMTYHEGGGGAAVELFAQAGAHTGFNSGFRLIGALPFTSAPKKLVTVGTWDYVRINGSIDLNDAIARYNNNAPSGDFLRTVEPTVAFQDPQNPNTGGHTPVRDFPGDTAINDDNFGGAGRVTLTIAAADAGRYTFLVYSDDSERFRILDSTGTPIPLMGFAGGAGVFGADTNGDAINDAFQTSGCCADALGKYDLVAGTYTLEVINNEQGGGAGLFVYGAMGDFNAFDPYAFQLAGENLNQPGTQVPGGLELVPFSLTTPYEFWINSFPSITNPADKLKAANPDSDEQNNLTEFALDGNPASGLATGKFLVKVAPVGGSNTLTITLPVRIGAIYDPADPAGGALVLKQSYDGVTYSIQSSDELTTWTLDVAEVFGGDATSIQTGLPALSAGWVYRTFRSPGPVAGDPREFMRAVISE